MVADLFHYGHIQFLKKAKTFGNKLVVGIHSDKDVALYKRTPVLTMNERSEVVKACKYVDDVILDAPLETTDEFMNKFGLDIYIHAHPKHENDKYLFLSNNLFKNNPNTTTASFNCKLFYIRTINNLNRWHI